MNSVENRVHVRIAALLPCKLISSTGEHATVMLDLSRGGARIETPKQVAELGELITLIIRTPMMKTPVEVTAEVVRRDVREHGDSLGLRFAKVDPEMAKTLMKYIESIDNTAGGEARRHPRVMRRLEVALTTIAEFRAVMRDVSKGGMGLTCDVPVVLDEAVKVDVRVPNHPHLVLPGKVVHVRSGAPGTYRVGVKFDELLPETRALLDAFLSAMK